MHTRRRILYFMSTHTHTQAKDATHVRWVKMSGKNGLYVDGKIRGRVGLQWMVENNCVGSLFNTADERVMTNQCR
jgi:hypothetical protein